MQNKSTKNNCESILFFQERTIALFKPMDISPPKDLIDEKQAIVQEAIND